MFKFVQTIVPEVAVPRGRVVMETRVSEVGYEWQAWVMPESIRSVTCWSTRL